MVLLWPIFCISFKSYHYNLVLSKQKNQSFFIFQTCYVVYLPFVYTVPLKLKPFTPKIWLPKPPNPKNSTSHFLFTHNCTLLYSGALEWNQQWAFSFDDSTKWMQRWQNNIWNGETNQSEERDVPWLQEDMRNDTLHVIWLLHFCIRCALCWSHNMNVTSVMKSTILE